MSIADKLSQLNGIKTDIKNSIIAKGGSAGNDMTQYAAAISALPSGGESPWVSSVSGNLTPIYNTGACWKLIKSVDFSDIDMTGVINMGNCFTSSIITSITLPSSMPLVNNLYNTFNQCKSLTSISLPSDMTAVTNMYGCFNDCESLTSITLPSSMSLVNSLARTFQQLYAFENNISLPSDMTAVETMEACFNECRKITSITLPSSMPVLTSLNNAFVNCFALESIMLPSSMPLLNNLMACFQSCTSLTSISFPSDMTVVTNMQRCFQACSSISSITLPSSLLSVVSGNFNGTFNYCNSLENIDGIVILPDYNLNQWGLDNCPLNVSSLNCIIAALPVSTGGYTCTLGTTNLNKLTAEEIAVATNKGWTLN